MLDRTEKYFIIERNGRRYTVTIDRLELVYSDFLQILQYDMLLKLELNFQETHHVIFNSNANYNRQKSYNH